MEGRYSIKEAADRCGLSTHTLRYYEKEGLLPFVDRSESGLRIFKESDFNWIGMISCLKQSGLSIKEIRHYIDLCREGDSTLQERLEVFEKQKAQVEEQIAQLQETLDNISYKVWYYKRSIAAGTEGKLNPWECHNLEEEWLKETGYDKEG